MTLEQTLTNWTGPSSSTEQEKQERTERMIRQAIEAHAAFAECRLSTYAKGSYANNTNVRADSDVDIAVECKEAEYWEEEQPGTHQPSGEYKGIWTPNADGSVTVKLYQDAGNNEGTTPANEWKEVYNYTDTKYKRNGPHPEVTIRVDDPGKEGQKNLEAKWLSVATIK